MKAPTLALAACLSAALVAGAVACSGNVIDDAISGCGTPGKNQGIGISEECVREKHFAGCDLQLPHPPGVDDPLKVFTLDDDGADEDVITVTYLQPKDSKEPRPVGHSSTSVQRIPVWRRPADRIRRSG